jgi:hypothetical protein
LALRRMWADLLFWDPGDVNPAIADLIELGFNDFEEVMEFDDCGPTVFITARITTDMGNLEFFGWIIARVELMGGDAWQYGVDANPPAPPDVRGRLH